MPNGQGLNPAEKLWTMVQVLVALVCTTNIALTGWCLNSIVQLREQVSAMQADRFRADDGLMVWQEIARVREEMGNKADKDNVPPPEVVRWLERLERAIVEHGHGGG